MRAIEWIDSAAGVATAVGVGFAAVQLWHSSQELDEVAQQRVAHFEANFIDRYRQVVARIPLSALLDPAPYDPTDEVVRRAYFDYFELCAEELYYWRDGKVSDETWKVWRSGIEENLDRAAFRSAWVDLAGEAPSQFSLLFDESGLMPSTAPTSDIATANE